MSTALWWSPTKGRNRFLSIQNRLGEANAVGDLLERRKIGDIRFQTDAGFEYVKRCATWIQLPALKVVLVQGCSNRVITLKQTVTIKAVKLNLSLFICQT